MRKFLFLLLLTLTLPVMAQTLVLSTPDLLTPISEDKPTEEPAGLREVPDADRQRAQAAIPEQLADAQWGEWYEYDKGTFCYGSNYRLFFDSYTTPMILDRRDDLGGSGYSQIRFNKLFGDVDFIVYLDNNTSTISWEEMELPYTHEESTYDGHYFHLNSFSGKEWSLKRDMYLHFWFCIMPNYGYNFSDCYYRSSRVITDWAYSMKWEGLTNNMWCYNNTQTEAVLNYTPDPRVKRAQYLWYNRADYASLDLSEVTKYNPDAETLKVGENLLPFFDGAGLYELYIAFFDEENDVVLTGRYVDVRSNLFNPDEWEDVGIGKFDPILFDDYRRYSYSEIMYYEPDVTSFEPYDVKVIRRKDTPEIIRIVNPFNTGTPFENIDTIYGIFNGYYAEYDYYYDNETIMENYCYHDQDYFIEIDTRENELGEMPVNGYLFNGIYSTNLGLPFSGYVKIKDGVMRDFANDYILTLPGSEPKELTVVDVFYKDHRTINEIFFSEKYTQKSSPCVKVDIPWNVYKVSAALVSAEDYDSESTPKDVMAGKIPNTKTEYYFAGTSTYNFDFDYPDKPQSDVHAIASDNTNYKIVIVSASSNGDIQHVAAVDHVRSDNPDECVKIGTVEFLDPIFRAYGLEVPINADIYEYADRPGLLRIETPWEKSKYLMYPSTFASVLDTPTDLIIDATNPEKVEIIYGCVGYGSPRNDCYMWHALAYGTYYTIQIDAWLGDPECYGQYVKGDNEETITFPRMICASIAEYGDTKFNHIYGDSPTVFTITRDPGSVNEIVVDESDVAPVYYNLQGQPVVNPGNGIYIVRRGTKVTKEYLR